MVQIQLFSSLTTTAVVLLCLAALWRTLKDDDGDNARWLFPVKSLELICKAIKFTSCGSTCSPRTVWCTGPVSYFVFRPDKRRHGLKH